MIAGPLALATLLVAVAALAFALERRWRWAARAGASLLAILFGAVLSNAALVPSASPVYDAVFGPVTSLAIAWLLLAVDLRDLRRAGPRMLAAFALAVAATVVAAAAATLAFAPALGAEGWRLGGVMVGTYSGGSLNFVAVARAVGLSDSLFAAATAADNVMTAVWMGMTLLLPVWLARFWPADGGRGRGRTAAPGTEDAGASAHRGATRTASPDTEAAGSTAPGGNGRTAAPLAEANGGAVGDPVGRSGRATGAAEATGGGQAESHRPLTGPVPLHVLDLAVLAALGLALVWAAEITAERLPGVPSVIWLTTYALAAAQLPPVRRLDGALQLGTLALTGFFVVIGIGSRVSEILRVGPHVLAYTATVVAGHGLLLYTAARFARLDLHTTSVASQAAVGGPSTAMALAVGLDRPALALPGVLVGLLGYALGTYAGLAVAALLRSM